MPETIRTLTEREQTRLKELRSQVQGCVAEREDVRAALGKASREYAQTEEKLHRAEKELVEFVTEILQARRLESGDYRVSPDEGQIIPVETEDRWV